MKKVGFNRIPALTIDLGVAGILYLISILLIYSNKPTAAELGYGINSQLVAQEQVYVLLLGMAVWVIYAIGTALFLKRSIGQLLIGIAYPKEDSRLVRSVSILLSPLFIADHVLSSNPHLVKKNSAQRIFTVLGSVASIVSIPGLIVYLFILGFVVFTPRNVPGGEIGLCGEKYCLVQTNTSCGRDLDHIRNRTVEIVGENAAGTGIIISPSLVLTNYHVVENENSVSVREYNGRTSNAVLYTSNPDLDMAILIGQFSEGNHIQFADPQTMGEGTTDLYAIGYPGTFLRESGTGNVSVTKGIYSSFLDYPDYGVQLVQTDTPVNPGNSGGPLVNSCGQVVGIVTLTDRFDPLTGTIKEGLNFAISSTTVVPELNRLTE